MTSSPWPRPAAGGAAGNALVARCHREACGEQLDTASRAAASAALNVLSAATVRGDARSVPASALCDAGFREGLSVWEGAPRHAVAKAPQSTVHARPGEDRTRTWLVNRQRQRYLASIAFSRKSSSTMSITESGERRTTGSGRADRAECRGVPGRAGLARGLPAGARCLERCGPSSCSGRPRHRGSGCSLERAP